MKRLSLQRRITIGLAVSLAVIFSAQLWVASRSARRVVESSIAQNLGHETENLLAALARQPDGALALKPDAETPIYRRVYSGHYFAIHHGGGVIRSRSLWDEEFPALADGIRRVAGPKGQTLLASTASFNRAGQRVTITVAEDVTAIDAEIAAFRNRYALVAAGTLVLLLAAQMLIVRLALKPLERARMDAVRMERGETEMMETDVPAELTPFITQLNRLADITRKRLARSRNALGDLAHALKTPLAAIMQATEHEKVKGDEELYLLLNQSADKMARLMDKELRKARLAGGYLPGKGFDTARDIPPLLKTLELMHRGKAVRVDARYPDTHLAGFDSADMMELLGTLLDNAFKWAKGRVSLAMTLDDGLAITIEDDGPGCPPEKMELISGRGVRLDESVPGHGLGLAIARDIVESYNGRIGFSAAPLGGLRVSITFPSRR
ncbi:MAG: ATP-binding protein [Nitrospinae bacterium]|nr:ATP-binding protein [Nitrospinota bacterium]